MSFEMKVGDLLPILQVALRDPEQGTEEAAQVVDLSDVTAVKLRIKRGGNPPVEKTAVIVSALAGTVQYEWVAGDTDKAGKYLIEFVITYSSGKERTFPSTDWDHVLVSPRL